MRRCLSFSRGTKWPLSKDTIKAWPVGEPERGKLASKRNVLNFSEVEPVREPLNLIDTAIRSGIFGTFLRLVEGSPLERRLKGATSYTLFAPADIAFAFIPAQTINQLLQAENQGILALMLSHHAVSGKIMSSQLRDLSGAKSAYGEELVISNVDELRIGGARLLQADIEARNGIIHAIDRLLLPAKPATSVSV